MKKTLIVDGYNVIFAVADLRRHIPKNSAAAREGVTSLCHLFKSKRRDIEDVIVVFDGRKNDEVLHEKATPTTTHIYTTAKEDADRRIFKLVREADDPAALLVVSSDRGVYDRAKTWGAEVLTSHEFIKYVEVKSSSSGGSAAAASEKKIHPRTAEMITKEYKNFLGL